MLSEFSLKLNQPTHASRVQESSNPVLPLKASAPCPYNDVFCLLDLSAAEEKMRPSSARLRELRKAAHWL
jgi:hypothetical protein